MCIPMLGLQRAVESTVPLSGRGCGWPQAGWSLWWLPQCPSQDPCLHLKALLRFKEINPLINGCLDNLQLLWARAKRCFVYVKLLRRLNKVKGSGRGRGSWSHASSFHPSGLDPPSSLPFRRPCQSPRLSSAPGVPGHFQRNLLVGILF